MSIRLSHDLFAEAGNAWNTPNWQHNSSPVIRHRRGFDGELVDVEIEWEVEGYGPDGKPSRAPERRAWVDPKPEPYVRPKIEQPFYPKHRPAEYRRLREDVVMGKAQALTEDQLRARKAQRAAVKARLTRAQNRLAKQEQARKDAQAQLLVKLSQWEF